MLYDASKRDDSVAPRLPDVSVLVYCSCMMLVSVRCCPAPTGCWCGLPCLSKLWYGCAVDYCRLFHSLMVLGKKDDLYTSVRAYGRLLC